MCQAGGMSAEWTAPESGWYEFRAGCEPRKLTDAEVASAEKPSAGQAAASDSPLPVPGLRRSTSSAIFCSAG
jgi:hypothetical protein